MVQLLLAVYRAFDKLTNFLLPILILLIIGGWYVGFLQKKSSKKSGSIEPVKPASDRGGFKRRR
jgi:hypothetical protein